MPGSPRRRGRPTGSAAPSTPHGQVLEAVARRAVHGCARAPPRCRSTPPAAARCVVRYAPLCRSVHVASTGTPTSRVKTGALRVREVGGAHEARSGAQLGRGSGGTSARGGRGGRCGSRSRRGTSRTGPGAHGHALGHRSSARVRPRHARRSRRPTSNIHPRRTASASGGSQHAGLGPGDTGRRCRTGCA